MTESTPVVDVVDERVFQLTVGTEMEEIIGRVNAVTKAKELSADGQRVVVERADGIETMEFSHGSLNSFVFETRARRGPRPERKPREEKTEESTEVTVEASTEETVEASTEVTVEASTEETVEASTEETVEASTEETVEASTEETVETVEASTEETVETVEASTEETVEASADLTEDESAEVVVKD